MQLFRPSGYGGIRGEPGGIQGAKTGYKGVQKVKRGYRELEGNEKYGNEFAKKELNQTKYFVNLKRKKHSLSKMLIFDQNHRLTTSQNCKFLDHVKRTFL